MKFSIELLSDPWHDRELSRRAFSLTDAVQLDNSLHPLLFLGRKFTAST